MFDRWWVAQKSWQADGFVQTHDVDEFPIATGVFADVLDDIRSLVKDRGSDCKVAIPGVIIPFAWIDPIRQDGIGIVGQEQAAFCLQDFLS